MTDLESSIGLIILSLVWLLVGVAGYVWYAWALSRLFKRLGTDGWRGWVPVLNEMTIFERGGVASWQALFLYFPIVNLYGLYLKFTAAQRIGQHFGRGTGMAVLGVLVSPVWATILILQPAPAPGAAQNRASQAPGHRQVAGGMAAGQPAPGQPAAGAPRPGQPAPAVPGGSQPAPGAPQAGQPQQSPFSPATNSAPQAAPAGRPAPPAPPAPQAGSATPPPPAPPAPGAPTTGGPQAGQLAPPAPPAPGGPQSGQPTPPPPAPRPGQPAAGTPQAGEPAPPAPPASREPQAGQPAPPAPPAPPVPSAPAAPGGPGGPQTGQSAPPPPPPPAPSGPQTDQPTPPPPAAPDAPGGPGLSQPGQSAPPAPMPEPARPDSPVSGPAADSGPIVVHNPWAKPVDPAPTTPPPSEAPDWLKNPASASAIGSDVAPALVDDDDDDGETIVVDRRPKVQWHLNVDDAKPLPLEGDKVLLGRRPAATEPGTQVLAVPDSTRTLSKEHARLELVDGEWSITDLGSTNGVLIVDESGEESLITPGESVPVPGRFILGKVGMHISFEQAGT